MRGANLDCHIVWLSYTKISTEPHLPDIISLIAVEVGIIVEGCKSCKINKRGGYYFLEKTSMTLTAIYKEWMVEKI